ncbi:hypothetical protein AB0O14_18945 [Microbacterium foliorum]|uniref:hypothetical protein n=1 Tax=Rothia terrae TaxID=396015 RepID=UPI0034260A38
MNNITATTANLQAAGFFDWANNILNSTQALLGSVLVVVGLLVFIITAWASKTIPGVIGGLVVGAIIAGAGVIIVSLSGVFQQTIEEGNTTAASTSAISTTETNLS